MNTKQLLIKLTSENLLNSPLEMQDQLLVLAEVSGIFIHSAAEAEGLSIEDVMRAFTTDMITSVNECEGREPTDIRGN